MADYRRDILPLIEKTGESLRAEFGRAKAVSQKTERPIDFVTELDRSTENFIAAELHKLYPSIEFMGEEYGGNDTAEQFWLLDPIDGTGHFMRAVPFCTTMLALVQHGEPVFSVIYNFVSREMYVAEKGKGATLNGKPIHVSSRPIRDSYLLVETDYGKEENLKRFLSLATRHSVLKTANSGYEFTLVATGKIEAKICFDPDGKDWDYAPGSLLISEAGGIVRNIGSDSYSYRNHDFIAGNPVVYEEIVRLLAQAR